VKARNARNQTPSHEAKSEEVALFLIEHGADADAPEIQDRTPLHQVSEDDGSRSGPSGAWCRSECPVSDNATPLDLARRSEYWYSKLRDIEQLLLRTAPEVCTRENEGLTSSMRATAERETATGCGCC